MRAAGILFDKDGTLFDFRASYAPATAGVVRELAGNEALAVRMASLAGFDLSTRVFSPDSVIIAGTAHDMAALWHPFLQQPAETLPFVIDELFEKHSRECMTLFVQVPPVLSELLQLGMHIGLATNDSEANGRAHLGLAGIDHHFSFIAGHDSGHGAKPGPGMVQAFAAECGILPGAVLMVGDSRHDMDAARAAGAIAVAVATGLATAGELAPHADHVIETLEELLALPGIAAIKKP